MVTYPAVTPGHGIALDNTDTQPWCDCINDLNARASALESAGQVSLQSGAPNLSDFSNASMVDYLTGLSVPVPLWARDGLHFAELQFTANPIIITAAGTFSFRLVVASTNGVTSGSWQAAASTTLGLIVPMGPYTIPVSTTTLAVKLQAQRTAGTGALRLSSASSSTYQLFTVFHA